MLTAQYREYVCHAVVVMEKVVLVGLHNRSREVRFPSDPDGSTRNELCALEKAIRSTFSDVLIQTPKSNLIIQVSI